MRRGAVGFPLLLDVEGRRVVVVAGSEDFALSEAEKKVRAALVAGATVRFFINKKDALRELGRLPDVERLERAPEASDFDDAALVLLCASDETEAMRLTTEAERVGALFWAMDDPAHSHFSMPAIATLGQTRLAISTGGAAPALSARLRRDFERDLGPRFVAFVEWLGQERERLRAEEPDPEQRRQKLRALLDDFKLRIEVDYPSLFDPLK